MYPALARPHSVFTVTGMRRLTLRLRPALELKEASGLRWFASNEAGIQGTSGEELSSDANLAPPKDVHKEGMTKGSPGVSNAAHRLLEASSYLTSCSGDFCACIGEIVSGFIVISPHSVHACF